MESNVSSRSHERWQSPNSKTMSSSPATLALLNTSATTTVTSSSVAFASRNLHHRNSILTKRVRRPNFTPYELEALVAAMEKRPDLISGRLGGAYLRHGDLNKAWEEVCAEVNTFSLVEREVRECKDKWTDLKYRTKIKAVRSRIHTDDSNNSSPSAQQAALSPVEERIMDLIIDRVAPNSVIDEIAVELSCKDQCDAATVGSVATEIVSVTPQEDGGDTIPHDDVHGSPSASEKQPNPQDSTNLHARPTETPSTRQSLSHKRPVRREIPLPPLPFLSEDALMNRELVAVAVDIREELRSLVDLERQKVDLKRRKLDLEFARLHLQAKQYGFQLVKTEH